MKAYDINKFIKMVYVKHIESKAVNKFQVTSKYY